MDRIPVDMLLRLRLRNLNLHNLPREELDALYDSLSVQTMPEGRYDGRAWIYGHQTLDWLTSFVWRGDVFNRGFVRMFGWLASLVWKGKVFYRGNDPWLLVVNRVLGLQLFRGWFSLVEKTRPPMGWCEVIIYYPQLGLLDTARQVSPTLYLGRMQWRSWTVHFTLSKNMK